MVDARVAKFKSMLAASLRERFAEELPSYLCVSDCEAAVGQDPAKSRRLDPISVYMLTAGGERDGRPTAVKPLHRAAKEVLLDPKNRGLVITGRPGSGKGTLMKWAAYHYASAGEPVIPIYLELKYTPPDRLDEAVQGYLERFGLDAWYSEEFPHGSHEIFYLLDGFDEMPLSWRRGWEGKLNTGFGKGVRVAISSSEDIAPIDLSDYESWALLPLNRTRMELYLMRARPDDWREKLEVAGSYGLAGLASLPQYLSLIAGVPAGDPVPRTRAELMCASIPQKHLEGYEEKKRPYRCLPDKDEFAATASALAYCCVEETGGFSFSTGQAMGWLGKDGITDTQGVLEGMVLCGLLDKCEYTTDALYSFRNSSYQSYFAGLRIREELSSLMPDDKVTSGLAGYLVEHLDHIKWDEPLAMGLELLEAGMDHRPKTAAVISWMAKLKDFFAVTGFYRACQGVLAMEDRERLLDFVAARFSGKGLSSWSLLAWAREARAVMLIRRILSDPDRAVRCAAVHELTELADASSIPAIRALLEDDDGAVRKTALEALAGLGDKESIKALVNQLKNEDARLVSAAVETLVNSADTSALDGLCGLLGHPDSGVRRQAVYGLIKLGRTDQIEKLLGSGDASTVHETLEAVARMRYIEAAPQIRKLVAEKDAIVDSLAAETLRRSRPELNAQLDRWQPGGGRLVDVFEGEVTKAMMGGITELVTDIDDMVIPSAVFALAELGDTTSVPYFREMLEAGSSRNARSAAYALSRLGGRDSALPIRGLLAHDDPGVLRSAMNALAELGDTASAEFIRPLLTHGDAWVSGAAVSALAKLGDKDSLPAIRGLLGSGDALLSQVSAGALAELGDRETVADISGLLKSDDELVVKAAVAAIVELGGKEAILDIRALLDDDEPAVRIAAVGALDRLDDFEGVPEIIKLIEDDNDEVRYSAIEALVGMGGREVLPEVRRLLRHSDDRVKRAALFTLVEFGDVRAVEQIRKFTSYKEPGMRGAAALALAELGDKGSLQLVRDLAEDQDEGVRDCAVSAALKLSSISEEKDQENSIRVMYRKLNNPLREGPLHDQFCAVVTSMQRVTGRRRLYTPSAVDIDMGWNLLTSFLPGFENHHNFRSLPVSAKLAFLTAMVLTAVTTGVLFGINYKVSGLYYQTVGMIAHMAGRLL